MTRPKYFYEVEARQTVAHADTGEVITLQQAHLIHKDAPDSLIHLDRENAVTLRDALNKWLAETE